MKAQRSIDIAAPPDKVWPFLAEPDKILEWYIPLQKLKYTSEQSHEVGAPFYFEEKVTGGVIKLNCVVTEYIEKEKFAFKMTSGNMMKSYEEEWILKATPSGSLFTFMEQGKLGYGVVGRIIGPLAQRSSAATVEKMLAKLKSLVEA